MNKIFAMIGGGLLTLALLVIVLVVINKPAQSIEVTPAAQAIKMPTPLTPMPTLIQADITASAPVVMETSLQPSEYFEYIVMPNDTCAIIAANFNVPVEALLENNNLSPSCTLTSGQKLQLPASTSFVHPIEVFNNPPAEFLGDWVNADSTTSYMAQVSIQMKDRQTHINMFGVCQPMNCNFLKYSPAPTVDFNYDSKSAILDVMWIFDFQTLTQELTITSDGKLKVITQCHYLDNSGRLNFKTVEYFRKQ